MKDQEPQRRNKIPLGMWIVLVVAILASTIYSIPKTISTYRESELKETVTNYLDQRSGRLEEQRLFYQANLFFLTPEQNGTLILTPRSTEIAYGTGLDSLIEDLLRGPDLKELKNGSITLIPQDTQLIGSSIVKEVAYIEFSQQLKSSGNFGNEGTEFACRQIAATVKSLPYIEECVILIDGATFYYENASLY